MRIRKRRRSLKLSVAIKKRIGWRSRADAIRARGNYELELFGGKQAVKIEYHGIDGAPLGYARWRFVDPKQSPDGRKYTGRRGQSVQLYLCRGQRWDKIAKDTSESVLITEGEEKADFASESLDEAVIGTQGCDAFQAQGKPASLFDEIEWKGRTVTIVPDSDWLTNPGVRRGFARLGKFLASRGADVQYRLLPTLPQDFNKNPTKPKTGIDDYLARCDRDEWEGLPALSISDPKIAAWDTDDSGGLPAALLNMSPMPDEWLSEKPPEMKWVVNDLIALGETTIFVGGAGAGKTTAMIMMTIGAAIGRDVLNLEINEPRRVAYEMLERNEAGLRRRIHKAALSLELSDKERQLLINNFVPTALAGQQVRLIEHQKNQWTIHRANVDALIERMKEERIAVIVFDTLSRLHGGNSNDDSLATQMIAAFERITQATGAAVIILHHTGKEDRKNKYAGRGSSAWTDNTSNTIHLRLIEEEERKKVKVINPVKDVTDDEMLIVEMRHMRMSETSKMPPKHFAIKQGGDRDGWMWSVGVNYTSDTTSIVDDVRRWFTQDLKEHPFSRNQFIKACTADRFGSHIGRPTAEVRFKELLEEGHVVEKKGGRKVRRKGKPTYIVAADDMRGEAEKPTKAGKRQKRGKK